MKARAPFLPTLVGLAVLLILTNLAIPPSSVPSLPRTPVAQRAQLEGHEKGYYFIQGETLAKKLFDDPSARWSHFGIDAASQSDSINGRAWFAAGTVATPGVGGQILETPWEVCFVPDADTALHTKVGTLESGSLEEVRKAVETTPTGGFGSKGTR